MSISYCVILHLKKKEILAESAKGNKYQLELKSLYSEIFGNISSDQISIDNKTLFSYKKLKEVVYVVVTSKYQNVKQQPFIFIDELKKIIESEHVSIKRLLEDINNEIKEYCLQETLGKTIDNSIKSLNSEFAESLKTILEINKDVEIIKNNMQVNVNKIIDNIEDLKEPLVKADMIRDLAKDYKKKAELNLDNSKFCCNRKMKIIYICFIILLLIFCVYALVAFLRCGDMNAFCVN